MKTLNSSFLACNIPFILHDVENIECVWELLTFFSKAKINDFWSRGRAVPQKPPLILAFEANSATSSNGTFWNILEVHNYATNLEILKTTCSSLFFFSDDVVQMCVDYLREYPLLCGLMIGLPIILFIAFIYLTASSPEKPKSKKTKKKKSDKDQ